MRAVQNYEIERIWTWLGGRDSNPDSQIQSLESYHWTTSQQGFQNLRIEAALVK